MGRYDFYRACIEGVHTSVLTGWLAAPQVKTGNAWTEWYQQIQKSEARSYQKGHNILQHDTGLLSSLFLKDLKVL